MTDRIPITTADRDAGNRAFDIAFRVTPKPLMMTWQRCSPPTVRRVNLVKPMVWMRAKANGLDESEIRQNMIDRIAAAARVIGAQANVGCDETAGSIVSFLSANPHWLDHFGRRLDYRLAGWLASRGLPDVAGAWTARYIGRVSWSQAMIEDEIARRYGDMVTYRAHGTGQSRAFLMALEGSLGIPRGLIVQSITTGPNEKGRPIGRPFHRFPERQKRENRCEKQRSQSP